MGRPSWAIAFERRWKSPRRPSLRAQQEALAQGIQMLARATSRSSEGLSEQPFDSKLLRLSPLFRRSRELFEQMGGEHAPALLSSARTLGSASLLRARIEYSPIESELVFAAKHQAADLLRLRGFCTSLFHEQNHRILWTKLPHAPPGGAALRRFLNFAESLVVMADMALGDELGPRLAGFFHLLGVTYDPGTPILGERISRRDYRNYLQAALHATYLYLEGFDPAQIPRLMQVLYPFRYTVRAATRALNLDPSFVSRTNPVWQKKHALSAGKALRGRGTAALLLPDEPADNRVQYLIAEQWMDLLQV